MARIGIAALGTLGDVLPFVRLARGLRASGHEVVLSTTQRFESLARAEDLEFHALPGDPREIFETMAFNPERISPWRIRAHVRLVHRGVEALVGQSSDADLLRPWAGIDVAVFSPMTTFARTAADRLEVKSAMVALAPAVLTGAFPHPVIAPFMTLGSAAHRATWLIGERMQRQTYAEPLRPRTRRDWTLPSFPLAAAASDSRWPPFPVLHAFSEAVVPRPADWPDHVEVTGWLFPAERDEPLPTEIEEFLADGEPPLYIGFGSMLLPRPEETAQIVVSALAASGQRAIVSGEALESARTLRDNASVLVAPRVAHDQLFTRLSGVVHHGGSGTTGTGLRAGCPTLVVPTVVDQFFWGRRVQAIGAGPAPVPFSRLTSERLAAALRELRAERIRVAAREVGKRIAAENGVERAVASVERLL